MNCSRAQESFPELLDPRRAAAADTAEVRAHLATCPDCQREYASLAATLGALDQLPAPAPSPRLRAGFYALLEEEKNSAASIRATVARRQQAARLSLLRWILAPVAAAALAFGGFYFGARFGAPAAPADDGTKAELAKLRSQMEQVNQLVATSLLQQRTTSERLQTVLASLDQKNPDQKILSNLIGSLALDPSVNVRLSALDALYPHASQKLVRDGVLATFPREQNPLVKVAMIDFLVAARDRNAAPELEKLARDETIDRAVRDAARRGLAQL